MKFLYMFLSLLYPQVTNYSPGAAGETIANDVQLIIADEVLRLSTRNLVAYQFGQKYSIPKNAGRTYTMTRYERINLPFAPLSEGVSSTGQALTIQQVSATAQQWGDSVRVTDIADMTIKHPLFKQAIRLISKQQSETVERNTLNILLTGTQVNYANNRASRASITGSDVLTISELSKIVGSMETFGVPTFSGDNAEEKMGDANKRTKASSDPSNMPHYVALIHPLPTQDLRQITAVTNAWAYSDLNRLYNNDMGEWGGVRFCKTNMMPYWTGVAAINGAAGSAGGLATGTYYIQVTASPASTSVEQRIYQLSSSISVTGPTGSISVTLPTLANYVFNVYIGTSSVSPSNLATCASGPAIGPLAGQAVQLTGGQTVILTGVGVTQVPPAAPATGVTVFPTIFMGEDAYGQVMLDDVKYNYLDKPDKSDIHNQYRVVSWTMMYGTIILNQAYMARVESASAYSVGYTAGTATE